MSYLKTWYPYHTPIKLEEAKIIVSAKRLVHTLKLKQINLQKEAKSLEHNLLTAINGTHRSLQGELELMEAVIRKSELVAAYEEIIRCANVIQAEAKILELDSTKASEKCILAICTLMFSYKDLELSECIDLSIFVPEPHPLIDKNQISQPLREYVEFQGATQFAINTYVLEMCARNNMSLEKVNEIGHAFSYSPSKLPERSKSIAMFAISLEDEMGNFDPNSDFAAEAEEDDNNNNNYNYNVNENEKREYQPSQILE